MNIDLIQALTKCETDIDGAVYRLSGSEDLYVSCLIGFLNDPTMSELEKAIDSKNWDDAFTAAHALKGLAGNMGFVPLFHCAAELVVFIRAGRINELTHSLSSLKNAYSEIITIIKTYALNNGGIK